MNTRTARLRQEGLDAIPTISAERALLLTEFYRENLGRHSTPLLRALSFRHLCERKTLFLGEGELIVGERGPLPKAVPTYPELTCHSVEDLTILDSRPKTWYRVPPEVIAAYEETVIPYWRGRSMRDQVFPLLPPETFFDLFFFYLFGYMLFQWHGIPKAEWQKAWDAVAAWRKAPEV